MGFIPASVCFRSRPSHMTVTRASHTRSGREFRRRLSGSQGSRLENRYTKDRTVVTAVFRLAGVAVNPAESWQAARHPAPPRCHGRFHPSCFVPNPNLGTF